MLAQVRHQVCGVQSPGVSIQSEEYTSVQLTLGIDSGGYLSGKLLAPTAKVEDTSHFNPKWELSQHFAMRYLGNEASKHAVQELKDVADKHGLQLPEVAYRWLQHHSELRPGDLGIVLGASSPQQLENSILDKCVYNILYTVP